MVTEKQHEHEDKVVSWTLRLGSYGSIGLIIIGALLSVLHVIPGEIVLRAGFLLLMFTPALRIVVAGILYLRERDYRYALVSLIVLTIVTLTSVLSMMGILPRLEK